MALVPALGDFDAVIMDNAAPRDRFMFMLLERVERLETHIHYLERELEETQNVSHSEKARMKRNMLMFVVGDYRNFFAGYTMSDGWYWMRMLIESLTTWYGDREIVNRATREDALAYMRSLTKTVVSLNEDLAVEIGRYFIDMSMDDIEAFIMWDELPDLL